MANSCLLRKHEDTLKSRQVEWVISVQQKFVIGDGVINCWNKLRATEYDSCDPN